jgi:hypothetical protein
VATVWYAKAGWFDAVNLRAMSPQLNIEQVTAVVVPVRPRALAGSGGREPLSLRAPSATAPILVGILAGLGAGDEVRGVLAVSAEDASTEDCFRSCAAGKSGERSITPV